MHAHEAATKLCMVIKLDVVKFYTVDHAPCSGQKICLHLANLVKK